MLRADQRADRAPRPESTETNHARSSDRPRELLERYRPNLDTWPDGSALSSERAMGAGYRFKPTRGLEPRTPSLRVSRDAAILAFLSHISGHEVRSDDLTFAEFGTYFGTRLCCSRGGLAETPAPMEAGASQGADPTTEFRPERKPALATGAASGTSQPGSRHRRAQSVGHLRNKGQRDRSFTSLR
jgi:hypothetical protein